MLTSKEIDDILSDEVDGDAVGDEVDDVTATDPDLSVPDAIRIGVDGYCRAPDLADLGRTNSQACFAIRAAFEDVNDALREAGYEFPEQTDVPAFRCLKNINARCARAYLTGDAGDEATAAALLGRITDGTLTELANVPRAEQKKKATKKGDG